MHDGIDTPTPAGRFSLTIAAVAELERELIRAGLAAGHRGKKLGRSEVTFGDGRRSDLELRS